MKQGMQKAVRLWNIAGQQGVRLAKAGRPVRGRQMAGPQDCLLAKWIGRQPLRFASCAEKIFFSFSRNSSSDWTAVP